MSTVAPHRENHISLWRCDRILHLEIWDAIQGGRSLAGWRNHRSYVQRIAGAISALREGHLETVSGFQFPPACRSIASVWLCGGDPRSVDLASCLRLPAGVDPDGPFAAVRAGRDLLNQHGMVVDLGQTSAKVWSADHGYRRIERKRRGFQSLLRATLVDERFSDTHALVLALPCEILGDRLGPCSYFDDLPLSELSALLPCPTLIANDADLAAASTLGSVGEPREPALVLTLGFGIGAALVLP